jgi:heme o synthase
VNREKTVSNSASAKSISLLRSYYYLTKPGIIYGNLLSAVAGFFLASKTAGFDFWLFIITMAGIALVIGSACVFNNVIDIDIDSKMTRTKNRAFVTGVISVKAGLVYGAILLLLGVLILAVFTNWLTLIVGLVGFVDYVALYTPSKRRTVHSTAIGTICGATPIVAGYTAVSSKLDVVALLLFLIMVFWQMSHFYAIALRRLDEYKAAKLPVMPVLKGIQNTKIQIIFYVVVFTTLVPLLFVFGYTGLVYAFVVVGAGLYWLYLGITGFYVQKYQLWAKKMFGFSLIVLLTFCLGLVVDSLIGFI